MAVMPQRARDDCVAGLFNIMRKHAPLRYFYISLRLPLRFTSFTDQQTYLFIHSYKYLSQAFYTENQYLDVCCTYEKSINEKQVLKDTTRIM